MARITPTWTGTDRDNTKGKEVVGPLKFHGHKAS